MNRIAIAILLGLIIAVLCPAYAAVPEKYGYITVDSVDIDLKNGYANLHIDYSIDDGMKLLILMLGKGDLKSKIYEMLDFYDAKITEIEMDSADLVIKDVESIYGDGLYWFPEHEFKVTIPKLTIKTPQGSVMHLNTDKIPKGICYY